EKFSNSLTGGVEHSALASLFLIRIDFHDALSIHARSSHRTFSAGLLTETGISSLPQFVIDAKSLGVV
ncbi:MAG TPA: hypothetical protein DCK93_14445, partial [Blastocatellia bacterium]|nr:hypothetical protein [Blastocatellia bacterium]